MYETWAPQNPINAVSLVMFYLKEQTSANLLEKLPPKLKINQLKFIRTE